MFHKFQWQDEQIKEYINKHKFTTLKYRIYKDYHKYQLMDPSVDRDTFHYKYIAEHQGFGVVYIYAVVEY
jgi:hypothetical protein